MPGARSMALVTPHGAKPRHGDELCEVLLMALSGRERSSVFERIEFNIGAIKEELQCSQRNGLDKQADRNRVIGVAAKHLGNYSISIKKKLNTKAVSDDIGDNLCFGVGGRVFHGCLTFDVRGGPLAGRPLDGGVRHPGELSGRNACIRYLSWVPCGCLCSAGCHLLERQLALKKRNYASDFSLQPRIVRGSEPLRSEDPGAGRQEIWRLSQLARSIHVGEIPHRFSPAQIGGLRVKMEGFLSVLCYPKPKVMQVGEIVGSKRVVL